MAQTLGVTTSAASESYWSENSRRSVSYQYPQGKAPFLALLSMLREMEVDKPKFGWWEHRALEYKDVTVANSTGCWGDTASTPADQADGFDPSAGDSVTLFVNDATQFRVRDVIWVKDNPNEGDTANLQIKGIVTAQDTTNNYLTVTLQEAYSNVSNAADSVGLDVFIIGSAAGEGDRSRTGGMTRPIEIENFTQICRQAYSLTRNALKAGVRYDSDGDSRHKAHEACMRTMAIMERSMLWGTRWSENIVNDDGETVPRRTMGGIEWYLKQWELGTTGNGAVADYRAGGSDVSSSAWATTDEKRILGINGGMTKSQFYAKLEVLFRTTHAPDFVKVCLCGSGFMAAFNEFIDNRTLPTRRLFENGKAGFDVKEWESPHGTILFKTHPLMNQSAAFRNDAVFLDMGNLFYVYLQDSDLQLLTNRQANDADARKDEWLGECSLWCEFPETHMIWKNVTAITP